MKRFIKLGLAILVVLTLCLGLCSCKEMDELREKRAEWGDDLKTVIVFDGEEYKLLSPCKDLVVDPQAGDNYGYVTLDEVPLLLTDSFGSTMKISRDREMLVAGHWEDGSDCSKVYARSDLYKEIESSIKSYELGWLCSINGYYDYDAQEFVTERHLMPEAVNIIVNNAMSAEGEVLSTDDMPYGQNDITLYFCDKSLRFVRETKSVRFTMDDIGDWYMVYERADDDKPVRVGISKDDIKTVFNAFAQKDM